MSVTGEGAGDERPLPRSEDEASDPGRWAETGGLTTVHGGSMPPRSNRKRHAVSKRQLATLRVLGWRYSTTRKAWVHRAFNGRVGPAFRDRAVLQYDFTIEDLELLDELVDLADVAQPTIVEGERPPLPRRAAVTRRPQIPVEASLDGREPPRVVLVDGRPPRRGVDLRLLRRHDDVVTPIKSSRAASA